MKAPAAALPSLRREVATSLIIVASVWFLAIFVTIAYGIRHEVDDLMDDALQEAAEVLYGTLVLHMPLSPEMAGDTLPAPPHHEHLVWQIVDQDLQVTLRSHRAPSTPMLATLVPGLSDGFEHRRVYAIRLPEQRHVLLVGQNRFERLEARWEAIAIVGSSGVVVSLVCAGWMRRRMVRTLRPLHELSEQIKAYDPTNAQIELPAPSHQEFVQVRSAIVDLGGRLAHRLEQEHAFSAHAAHALRTPLAGMDAQLAMAMKDAPEPTRKRLLRARQAAARLTSVVTSLLTLFRSQSTPNLQPVWIGSVVERLPIEGLAIHVQQQAPLTVDADLVAAALSNLLDNSRRYGAKNCWLSVQSVQSSQTLTVRDDGCGLAQAQIDRLQAGIDAPIGDGPGGLGLKLAALVARAHRGRLRIAAIAPDGGGLSVSLSFWEEGLPPVTESDIRRKPAHPPATDSHDAIS